METRRQLHDTRPAHAAVNLSVSTCITLRVSQQPRQSTKLPALDPGILAPGQSTGHVDDNDGDEHISFIVGQLKLSLQSKYGRHCSPQPTIWSYIICAASSAAYTVLRDEKVLNQSIKTLIHVDRPQRDKVHIVKIKIKSTMIHNNNNLNLNM